MSDHPTLVQPALEHLDTLPVDTSSVFAELVCADPGLLRAEFQARHRRCQAGTRAALTAPTPCQHTRPEQCTPTERRPASREVIDRPLSRLGESDDPMLVTTMID